jgi:hypothetical protein
MPANRGNNAKYMGYTALSDVHGRKITLFSPQHFAEFNVVRFFALQLAQ